MNITTQRQRIIDSFLASNPEFAGLSGESVIEMLQAKDRLRHAEGTASVALMYLSNAQRDADYAVADRDAARNEFDRLIKLHKPV